jgi:K+-transporting ATPase KdpF subunit
VTLLEIATALLAALVGIYLLVALLAPERF